MADERGEKIARLVPEKRQTQTELQQERKKGSERPKNYLPERKD